MGDFTGNTIYTGFKLIYTGKSQVRARAGVALGSRPHFGGLLLPSVFFFRLRMRAQGT